MSSRGLEQEFQAKGTSSTKVMIPSRGLRSSKRTRVAMASKLGILMRLKKWMRANQSLVGPGKAFG